jgi:hypothetical protein
MLDEAAHKEARYSHINSGILPSCVSLSFMFRFSSTAFSNSASSSRFVGEAHAAQLQRIKRHRDGPGAHRQRRPFGSEQHA